MTLRLKSECMSEKGIHWCFYWILRCKNCKHHKMYSIYFSWKCLLVFTSAALKSGTKNMLDRGAKYVTKWKRYHFPLFTRTFMQSIQKESQISSCLVTKRKRGTRDCNEEWQKAKPIFNLVLSYKTLRDKTYHTCLSSVVTTACAYKYFCTRATDSIYMCLAVL